MPRSPRIDNDDTPMAFAHASSGRSLQEIRSIRSIEVQVATTVCSEARGSLASLIGLKYRTMKPMACAFFIGFEQPETAVEHLRIHLVIVYSEPFFSTRNIGFPYKVNLAVFEHDSILFKQLYGPAVQFLFDSQISRQDQRIGEVSTEKFIGSI